jgi:hypothetical protein
MVDRLFSLWQELHPESYVESAPQSWPTFWHNQGDIKDSNSGKIRTV